MRGNRLYASRVTTTVSAVLARLSRVSPVYTRPTVEPGQRPESRRMRRLAYNDFHPIPTDAAPRYIRHTFALARGFVPSTSLVHPLSAGNRAFSSFHGSAHQFVRDVHTGDVIVFFYKPACGPCAVIRDKIKTAASKLAASMAEGEGGTRGEDQQAHRIVLQKASSASAAASAEDDAPTRWLDEGGDGDGEAATISMSPEDHAMCVQLRSHLSKVTDDAATAATPTDATGDDTNEAAVPHRRTIRFLAVNTNENDRLTALHDVRSLPTFVAYHNGKIVGRAEGAHEGELLALVKALKQASASSAHAQKIDTQPQAVAQAPVG